jgi:cell division protein FtsB
MPAPKIPKIKLPEGPELRSRLIFSIGAFIVVYMLIATFQALWQNYRLDRELKELREENGELQIHNKYLQSLIAYRRTDSYKDKQAREKLNYQKTGETVLIVPRDTIERFTEGNAKKQPQGEAIKRKPTNPEKWWQYFFARNREVV